MGSLKTTIRRDWTWSWVCGGDHIQGFQDCCLDAGTHFWSKAQEAVSQLDHLCLSTLPLSTVSGERFVLILGILFDGLQQICISAASARVAHPPGSSDPAAVPKPSRSPEKKTLIHNVCAHFWRRASCACFLHQLRISVISRQEPGSLSFDPVCILEDCISQVMGRLALPLRVLHILSRGYFPMNFAGALKTLICVNLIMDHRVSKKKKKILCANTCADFEKLEYFEWCHLRLFWLSTWCPLEPAKEGFLSPVPCPLTGNYTKKLYPETNICRSARQQNNTDSRWETQEASSWRTV